MNKFFNKIINKNSHWKVDIIAPHIIKKESLLDYGCGDLSLVHTLRKKDSSLKLTGVDVVDFRNRYKGITFIKYDGEKLPFKDNMFDTVISFYVYHHCNNPYEALRECLRVAKKRVIFVEAVSRYRGERYLMGIVDYIYNIWKIEKIPITYKFLSVYQWTKMFKKLGVKTYKKTVIKNIFTTILPVGQAYIFEVKKKK